MEAVIGLRSLDDNRTFTKMELEKGYSFGSGYKSTDARSLYV